MTTYIYVDNSNLYIEGYRVAAVRNGLAKNIEDAMKTGVLDHSWAGYPITGQSVFRRAAVRAVVPMSVPAASHGPGKLDISS